MPRQVVQLLVVVIAVLVAAAPRAQTSDSSEGPLLALAQGMSVDGASILPVGDEGSLAFGRSEMKSTPPDLWTPKPGFLLPDFAAMPFMGVPGLDVDAMSIGSDFIAALPDGVVFVAPGNVAACTFSVTRGTAGAPGGLIAGEVAGAGGAAADVFGYIFEGSAMPPSWVGVPLKNHDGREIAVDGNIDAHDLFVGLFFEENPQLAPLVPGYPDVTLWFSVTTATIGVVPAAWWGGAAPSGAVVFATTWSAATSAWSSPAPAFLPADFGVAASEDVDAFAYDTTQQYVLFSTDVTPAIARDPLLFLDVSAPGVHHVFRRSDGQPISDRVGLRPGGIDDIDGICALDPGSGPGSPMQMPRVIGRMLQPLVAGVPGRIGCSVTRRLAPSGNNAEVVTRMTGFPVPGPPQPGIAFCGVALVQPANPFTTASSFLRPSPSSPYFGFDGHPERHVLQLPNAPSFTGLPVVFAWVAFDFASQIFDVTPPVRIVL